MLQRQLTHPKSLAKFDSALRSWADHDTALANIVTHDRLAAVLNTRDYECHDSILHTLLQRAALLNGEGTVAAQIVLTAMLAAVPGIARRVIRASRTAVSTFGTRRGLTGGGVSATETNTDVQASVIGHLWEQIRCYPIRRRHHVAANVVRETQRAALRTLGIDITQAAAEVISINDAPYQQFVDEPAKKDASEELLELLSWPSNSDGSTNTNQPS
ncbi:hypothetical protein ACFWMR_19315 [Amycolatopsis thailandensis]|uniref:hypothetical protein n=1 Tax=Amycolatopsis thailandensis TaxID=589330 RepID=UPI00364CEB6F